MNIWEVEPCIHGLQAFVKFLKCLTVGYILTDALA